MFAFSTVLMASWEVALGVATIGLLDGGTAGLIWMFFVCWWGFMAVNTSMAEMASMAPTSGGQYHWVSEFAPPQYQKFLSYLIGWLCMLAWQVAAVATAYQPALMIQGLLVLNYPDSYVFQRWHGSLLIMAVSGLAAIINTIFAKHLHQIEGFVLAVHLLGYLCILIPLWVLGPIGEPTAVFTEFSSFLGWDKGYRSSSKSPLQSA